MTYCCRGFKAAPIHVWFIEAMPGKEWVVPVSGSKVWCETIQNYYLFEECTVVNQKMEVRMSDWSRWGSDTSFSQIAKTTLRYNFANAVWLCIKRLSFLLLSTVVSSLICACWSLASLPLCFVSWFSSFLYSSLCTNRREIRKNAKQS